MDQALAVIETVSNTLWVLLALVAGRLAWKHPGRAATFVAATFATAAAVVVIGLFMPTDGSASLWLVKPWAVGLLAISFLLHQVVQAMSGQRSRVTRGLMAVGLLVVAFTLLTPSFPGPDEPTSLVFGLYTALFLGLWAAWTLDAARRLLSASRGQPSVVRHRLRLLAAGSVGLAVALLAPTASKGSDLASIVGAASGVLSGGLFLVGFAPPALLRRWWREPEERELVAATRELMLADGETQIAEILLPAMVRLMGASGGVLRRRNGRLLAESGTVPAFAIGQRLVSDDERLLRVEVARQEILLWTSPWAPMLGEDERQLVARLAVLADLALDRASRLASERAAVRDAELARGEVESFVAMITHDLRSPLTSIAGMAELLEGPLRGDLSERAGTFVARISSNASYMNGLVSDILDLADVGGRAAQRVEVDLAALVDELAVEVGMSSPRARVLRSSLPVVLGDPIHLRRLLRNLVDNAVAHAGREDVDVHVVVLDDEPGWWQLAVRDNGRGIRPQDAERVFALFQRSEDDGGGTGLGLAICRRTVEAMGGAIWFAGSRAGADVRIRLPQALIARDAVGDGAGAYAEAG